MKEIVFEILNTGSPFDIDYFSKTSSSMPTNDVVADVNGGSDNDGNATSFISIIVFLAGVITARFGLWTADLVTIILFGRNFIRAVALYHKRCRDVLC
jgi:hypothetical protein